MARGGAVYMLASQKGGTIYTGVTADLPRRVHEHESGAGSLFAARHGALRLVWYDEYPDIVQAITREKTIKKWCRRWKVEAIEARNPGWHCLKSHLILW